MAFCKMLKRNKPSLNKYKIMPYLKTYRLFISHAWDYNDEYYQMINNFRNANNFDWSNYSVPEHDPMHFKTKTQLTAKLDEQIRQVNVFIVLGGLYVSHRDWIQKEIDIAQAYNKPILGIRPWGNVNMPSAVSSASDQIVGWNIGPIISAIRELG